MVEGLVLEGSVWGGVASGGNKIFCEVGLLERTAGISMLVSERVVDGGISVCGRLRGLVLVSTGITAFVPVVGILAVGFIDGLRSTTSSVSVTFVGGKRLMGRLRGLVLVSTGITAFVAVVSMLAVGFIDGLRSTTSSVSVFSLVTLLFKNFSLNPEDRPSLLSIPKPEGTVSLLSLFVGLILLLKNFSLKPSEGMTVSGGEG